MEREYYSFIKPFYVEQWLQSDVSKPNSEQIKIDGVLEGVLLNQFCIETYTGSRFKRFYLMK